MPSIDHKKIAEAAAQTARNVQNRVKEIRGQNIETVVLDANGHEAGRERSKKAAEKRMEAAKLPDLKVRELVAETARNHRGFLECLMGSNNYNERVEKNYNEARNNSKKAAEDKTQGR